MALFGNLFKKQPQKHDLPPSREVLAERFEKYMTVALTYEGHIIPHNMLPCSQIELTHTLLYLLRLSKEKIIDIPFDQVLNAYLRSADFLDVPHPVAPIRRMTEEEMDRALAVPQEREILLKALETWETLEKPRRRQHEWLVATALQAGVIDEATSESLRHPKSKAPAT